MLGFIIFTLALLAFITLCISDCKKRQYEHPDAAMCRKVGIVIAVIVMFCNSGIQPEPVKIRPTSITFWNRHTRPLKRRWEVVDYRRPDVQLPAADYMMGVELAKTNACSFFDLSQDSEIDRLKRCFYFFPSIRQEYVTKYEDQVGFCI